jgi:glycosyltransferase involved in cell wall biosynthesis
VTTDGVLPQPLRVALVASSYHPYFGGVEEHVRHVARELVESGALVEVWTVDRGEHLGDRTVDGILVRYLPTPLPARSVGAIGRFGLRAPGTWWQWMRAHTQFQPDVMHVHCFGPNGIYALALHRRTRTPLAVTSHGETIGDDNRAYQRSRLLRARLTTALAEAAFVTAPSEYVLDELRRNFGLHTGQVVPNGVDSSIRPRDSRTRIESAPFFLGVGRLGRVKGFDLLIDAFKRSDLAPTHKLLIAGDGPERNALARMAHDHRISDAVRFLGRLGSQDVADAMAQARAVVVPSRSEAFGIVALEAWRSGTALIMTSHGGASEFVRDGLDGVLVDPFDADALANALATLAHDDVVRDALASRGHDRVGEFGWRRAAQAYLRLYRGLPPKVGN